MPKNIYLPKDNIPKVEEVRKIENHIPTYEEFLKNYNQEKVNYKDLTHDDISSNKGFGPCSWNNSNCECYLSQGFALLRMPCPIDNCRMTISNWFHSNSGYLSASSQTGCGTLVMSSNGRIKCSNCGTEESWKEWKFSCPNRQGIYNQMNDDGFMSSLSVAVNLEPNISPNRKRIIGVLVQALMNDNY